MSLQFLRCDVRFSDIKQKNISIIVKNRYPRAAPQSMPCGGSCGEVIICVFFPTSDGDILPDTVDNTVLSDADLMLVCDSARNENKSMIREAPMMNYLPGIPLGTR